MLCTWFILPVLAGIKVRGCPTGLIALDLHGLYNCYGYTFLPKTKQLYLHLKELPMQKKEPLNGLYAVGAEFAMIAALSGKDDCVS